MTDGAIFTTEALARRIGAIFRACGLNAVQAEAIAGVIATAERDACKSHGLYRIEGVLRTLRAGKVSGDALPEVCADDGTAIVRVDARGGLSNPAFALGLPLLAERARAWGLAALVINDCTHFAVLSPEVEAVAACGLAGLALCPSYASVAPAGGARRCSARIP